MVKNADPNVSRIEEVGSRSIANVDTYVAWKAPIIPWWFFNEPNILNKSSKYVESPCTYGNSFEVRQENIIEAVDCFSTLCHLAPATKVASDIWIRRLNWVNIHLFIITV